MYLRISLDRNMDGLAIERQREDCVKIAEFRGWEIVETYIDQSKSATNKTKARPAYDRMVRDDVLGRFNAIICWDLDRLMRQPRQLEDWIDAAEDHGLILVAANGEADLSTDGGRMYDRIKAAVARGEVDRMSARQSAAHVQRAKQGRPPKGVRPLGYDIKGELIPAEAEVWREIFRLFAIKNGTSIAGIAAALSGETGPQVPTSLPHLPKHSHTLAIERNERRAEEGLEPRPVPPDGRWSASTVLGILRNPRYAGYSVYTDRMDRTKNKRRRWYAQVMRDEEGQPIRGQWTPIVEESTWIDVQERLNDVGRVTNRSGSTARRHLGAGMYRCGVCDEIIRSHSRGYTCPAERPSRVTRSRIHIDNWVITLTRERLRRSDLRSLIPKGEDPRSASIQKRIVSEEGKIKRAQADYDQELIEAHDLKRIRDRANMRITALLKKQSDITLGPELYRLLGSTNPVEVFDKADLALKRLVIDTLMEVRLLLHPRGKKGFNPESVLVTPRQALPGSVESL